MLSLRDNTPPASNLSGVIPPLLYIAGTASGGFIIQNRAAAMEMAVEGGGGEGSGGEGGGGLSDGGEGGGVAHGNPSSLTSVSAQEVARSTQ